jgi:hypothetical protein
MYKWADPSWPLCTSGRNPLCTCWLTLLCTRWLTPGVQGPTFTMCSRAFHCVHMGQLLHAQVGQLHHVQVGQLLHVQVCRPLWVWLRLPLCVLVVLLLRVRAQADFSVYEWALQAPQHWLVNRMTGPKRGGGEGGEGGLNVKTPYKIFPVTRNALFYFPTNILPRPFKVTYIIQMQVCAYCQRLRSFFQVSILIFICRECDCVRVLLPVHPVQQRDHAHAPLRSLGRLWPGWVIRYSSLSSLLIGTD